MAVKILIIGYGSMGRRRIRILSGLIDNIEIICVDSNPNRIRQAKETGLKVYESLEEALNKKYSMAFVCTSPGYHAEIILQLIEAGIHTFTELNLIDDRYEEIIRKSKEKGVKVFMSNTLLYNEQIKKIVELVKAENKPLTYIYHVGQYLCDWHPWENYKEFFAGKKETNGVREILAIQLPWLLEAFGEIEALSVQSQKCTSLEIDYKDSIIVNFQHSSGDIGVFCADVVSRKATTHLEVIGEEIHILWNGHNDDLFIYDISDAEFRKVQMYELVEHAKGYSDNIIENQYRDEIKGFLDLIYLETVPKYSLEQDKYTLSIINEIERTGR